METSPPKKESEEQKIHEIVLDSKNVFQFCRQYYVPLFLLSFMILGFYLRSSHLDFPVIGYHNMKENQYIPYTEFMYHADEFWDYFRTETYWIGTQEHGYFTQYEFPLIPWLILFFWKIFGIKLWAARLVIILFSIASIPLLYIVGKKLTRNTFILLAACLFFTIMPISVFFGRNVQPEAPGLFFILLATYWFFCWREEILLGKQHWKFFVFFAFSLLFAILLKVPNGIGLIPLLFFIPCKEIFPQKKFLFSYILLFIAIMVLFPLWVTFSKWVMPGAATVGTSGFEESFREVFHNIFLVFTADYWIQYYPALRSFVLDNFTAWFFWLTLMGIFFGFLKWKTSFGLFLVGSFISVFVYLLSFADKIRGHAYYQFVFLPLVCFASAYALYILAHFFQSGIARFWKQAAILLPSLLVVLFLAGAYPSITDATSRVFDTIFYGEDVAGDFIYKNSNASERVFIDGVFSQSVGILWHSHRYGTDEITANLTLFQELEQTRNFRWVVLYSYGMSTIQTKPDVWEHIQKNYKIRQMGFIAQEEQLIPYYFVLEKGGTFDPDTFVAGKQPYLAQTYTATNGDILFYVIDDLQKERIA